MTLGENIKHYRKLNNLTQDELASLIKIKRSSIAAYEANYSMPSIQILQAMSIVLEVSIDELVSGSIRYDGKSKDAKKRLELILKEISYNKEVIYGNEKLPIDKVEVLKVLVTSIIKVM